MNSMEFYSGEYIFYDYYIISTLYFEKECIIIL